MARKRPESNSHKLAVDLASKMKMLKMRVDGFGADEIAAVMAGMGVKNISPSRVEKIVFKMLRRVKHNVNTLRTLENLRLDKMWKQQVEVHDNNEMTNEEHPRPVVSLADKQKATSLMLKIQSQRSELMGLNRQATEAFEAAKFVGQTLKDLMRDVLSSNSDPQETRSSEDAGESLGDESVDDGGLS